MKEVLVFGSTGSIGKSALDVVRRDRDKFRVLGLCAYRNVEELKQQIDEFSPSYVCVVEETAANKLEEWCKDEIELFKGEEGLVEFASLKSDICVMAIPGIACLLPLLTSIENTRMVALANKESLVVGGFLVKEAACKFGTQLVPVDSEINALFQLFSLKDIHELRRIYLTASGGPLWEWSKEEIEKAEREDVLNHPVWKMGKRITVDSASLANKGFEVVEACCFFDLDYNLVDIVVHKECVIHAMVEFKDNVFFACFYNPDMRIPLSFALHYPERKSVRERFDLFSQGMILSFSPVDYEKFPLLQIILEAAKRGGNSLVVINASDEVAVDYFLKGKIKFKHLLKAVEHIFNLYQHQEITCLEEIFFWDKWARSKTEEYLHRIC